MSNANEIRFFYNGLKVGKGKLQKGHWSFCEGHEISMGRVIETHITLYARNYNRFSEEIQEAFTIVNHTDLMTDYFDCDHITLHANHPRFADAVAAHIKGRQRDIARIEKSGKGSYYLEQYRKEVEAASKYL